MCLDPTSFDNRVRTAVFPLYYIVMPSPCGVSTREIDVEPEIPF